VATDRQIAANRRNARRSTGPRSRAAKKRSSRNSFRHGLAAGGAANAERIKQIERLARKIAGARADFVTLECARTIAQAEFDLAQVRRIKVALMSRVMLTGGTPNASKSVGQLTNGEAETKQPDGTDDAIRRALSELTRLDRYERRAAARRARAAHILLERKRAKTI
jgi:hypothetical protein